MLQPIAVQVKPREVSQSLLRQIENKRVREVLERRFGLKSGKKETLEAIGRAYGITRERVRQIESDGLKVLARPAVYGLADSVFAAFESHLKEHGGVAKGAHLLESVSGEKDHPHVEFLLTVGKQFQKTRETESMHGIWFVGKEAKTSAEKIIDGVINELAVRKIPVTKEEMISVIGNHAEKVLGSRPKDKVLLSLLGTTKQIGVNPYGEYGLVTWATIRPKGVRDKAFVVLSKSGKPMHFRDIAESINSMQWTKKPAHHQTVHNELIKANDRFVLVGRGLYALRDWGYTPGTVAQVMKEVLKKSGKSLTREEVIQKVLEHRFVKENTILLNLQNRSLFSKDAEGKYFLA